MTVSLIDTGPLQSMLLGIKARLQLAFPASLFQFEIMPAHLTREVWDRLTNRPPLVGLGWNAAANKSGATFAGEGKWSVFLVVNNQTGEFGRLMGDNQGPGLLQVVQVAMVTLNGFKIPDLTPGAAANASVGTCIVRGASNAGVEWAKETLAVAVLDLEVAGMSLSVANNLQGIEATADLWNEVSSGWVFPEFGDQVQISDDYSFGTST